MKKYYRKLNKYCFFVIVLLTGSFQFQADANGKNYEFVSVDNSATMQDAVVPHNSHPQLIPVKTDSLSYYEKNPEKFTALINYFDSKGIELTELLKNPKFEFYDGIGDRFRRAVEVKSRSLDEYKGILEFEDKKSRMNGFMIHHQDPLKLAEEKYGIPKYVISAIIAVESDFGTKTGNYNPFNAYVSMYLEDYRAEFARAQLEELLIFTERNSMDIFELKSSYAGAVSAAQFIPYSLNRWFIGDDIFDMSYNILSVANYLAHFKNITGSIEKAVHRYNPSTLYTQTVLDLAKEAEELIDDPAFDSPSGQTLTQ